MKKFVWDTSALLNIKEPNQDGYSPASSLYKDFSDGWISGPYLNIFPAIAAFELSASISRKHREGNKMLRNFYIVGDNAIIYDIDHNLIKNCQHVFTLSGFDKLRGADLIFACIAYLEDAYLVTLDKNFSLVSNHIKVINLNISRDEPKYRDLFDQTHWPE